MCWKVEYVSLIIISTVIDYFVGLYLEKAEHQRTRRILLLISLCTNIGLLFAFKYLIFVSDNVRSLMSYFNIFIDIPFFTILLPVGISFYTFQKLSYTIEIYRRRIKAEKHIGIFATYVAFFPQLVAGPIERAQNLLPQFKERKYFESSRVCEGLQLFLWGLFKKVVIADLLATVVNTVYAYPQSFTGPILLLATFFFSIQIYCDFSGYSDMAIGVAKILGFDLMANFRQPYFSKSIQEFWRRWHISLSSWFRDYVYIPLGGNRTTKRRWYLNLLLVFLLCGVWHGANWTFIIWGIIHGLYLIFGVLTKGSRQYLSHTLLNFHKHSYLENLWKTVSVFMLVLVGWIFFRAQSLSDALYIVNNIFTFESFNLGNVWELGLPRFEMILSFILITILFIIDYMILKESRIKKIFWQNDFLRQIAYCTCIYSIIFFGVFKKVEFIYFQF